MRVLHYREKFSKLSETFLYGYLTELERQRVDCRVLTHERRNAEARPFSSVRQVDRPGKWHPRRLAHGLLVRAGFGESIQDTYLRERRRRLAAVGRDMQPDVVHAHFGQEGVFIAPVAKRLGRPLVVTFYGFDISSLPEEDGWAEAYREMWPLTDAVTVLSEEMKEAALELGCPEEKIHIVHLSRDLEQFSFQPPDRKVQRLLYVGRFTPKKAPLDAVRALERANQKGADLQLHIVGGGELRDDVERYVDDRGLEEEVVVHGREPSEKVAGHMRAADAFVLPSKTAPDGDREGTPTVLVEAQAMGLPCISTHHAGIPEMIPEQNHDLLVQEGDVEALVDRFLQVSTLSLKQLQGIAERGRRKIEKEFSLSGQCKKLQSIYQSVIDGRS
ncbi:glycosyltransferase [Salinibacter ruber]|uniref:glycosyltransferase n=1 Tax=Salinibacter ruber TaxID=146919 RepID=UPI002072EB08|nr:glycosyltransferase [Salinibacter ruber]MCS4116164.1 glycosyltransferase involved in cell wall biosynthesis [Salinibacter ruber]